MLGRHLEDGLAGKAGMPVLWRVERLAERAWREVVVFTVVEVLSREVRVKIDKRDDVRGVSVAVVPSEALVAALFVGRNERLRLRKVEEVSRCLLSASSCTEAMALAFGRSSSSTRS